LKEKIMADEEKRSNNLTQKTARKFEELKKDTKHTFSDLKEQVARGSKSIKDKIDNTKGPKILRRSAQSAKHILMKASKVKDGLSSLSKIERKLDKIKGEKYYAAQIKAKSYSNNIGEIKDGINDLRKQVIRNVKNRNLGFQLNSDDKKKYKTT
jgi:hypothetical protein